MKKSRFTEEKIIEVLKQLEAGRKVSELSREYGVSTASIYAWKSKYAGLEVSQLKRLKELEEENRKLKTLVADLSLDKVALLRRDRSNPRCWASETVVSLNLKIPLGALFGRFLPVLSAQKLLYRLLDPSYEREIHIARPPVGYSVTVFLELDCR